MKVVAVSQRVDVIAARNETRDALDQRLVEFLLRAGCLPVPIPNALDPGSPGDPPDNSSLAQWLRAIDPRAVVLSGGNDIGQCPARDTVERALLDHARAHALPLLGICRGMQMMAVWAGTLLRDVTGHVRTRHRLSGLLAGEVNSYHNQALSACPEGFDVTARSEDGEIEAIRHQQLPWEGWMWHPEREAVMAARDIAHCRQLFGIDGADSGR